MKKKLVRYWIVAFIFIMVFGEIVPGLISNNPTFLKHAIPIAIYYNVFTLVFAVLFNKMKFWMVLVIAFVYGGFAEVFFFKGIRIFVWAGLFYVFLLTVPYFIVRKMDSIP